MCSEGEIKSVREIQPDSIQGNVRLNIVALFDFLLSAVEIHSAVDEMESENTLMEHDIHRIVYVLSDYKA